MSVITEAVDGVELVEELDGGEGEDAALYRLDGAADLQVGEAIEGIPVVAQGVEYVVVVEAHMGAREIAGMMGDASEMSDEEAEQIAVMLTGDTEVNEAAVAISDEDGTPGPVVEQEGDVDGETVLAQFAEQNL